MFQTEQEDESFDVRYERQDDNTQFPPAEITVVAFSPSETQLTWQPPKTTFGPSTEYLVKICDEFDLCNTGENVGSCTEYNASKASLKFGSTADTTYCVLVFTILRCGMDVTKSQPVVKQIKTPLFALPQVQNLHLVSVVDRAVTIKWDQPQTQFDYYCIDTAGGRKNRDQAATHTVRSCENSTVILPNKTQATRGDLPACVDVRFEVQIYRKGPPELMSLAATLEDVFIPGQEHFQRPLYKWVPWNGTTVPEDAVLGGEDESHPTYICRAKHKNDTIPGKLVPRYHKCYVSYDGFEHEYNRSE
ncbi:hypothetical protein MTO96_035412, partial [Rhipicephalus appendiculatus]